MQPVTLPPRPARLSIQTALSYAPRGQLCGPLPCWALPAHRCVPCHLPSPPGPTVVSQRETARHRQRENRQFYRGEAKCGHSKRHLQIDSVSVSFCTDSEGSMRVNRPHVFSLNCSGRFCLLTRVTFQCKFLHKRIRVADYRKPINEPPRCVASLTAKTTTSVGGCNCDNCDNTSVL